VKKRAPKKIAKKDPNAPKRPLSAYLFFCFAERGNVKSANPDSKFGELSKMLGQKWKELDAEGKKI